MHLKIRNQAVFVPMLVMGRFVGKRRGLNSVELNCVAIFLSLFGVGSLTKSKLGAHDLSFRDMAGTIWSGRRKFLQECKMYFENNRYIGNMMLARISPCFWR